MNAIVHEMRNALAIAVANVEAFIDAKLEPTPRRLRSVSDALSAIDVLLVELAQKRLHPEPDDERMLGICAIISNEVVALAAAGAGARADATPAGESDRIGHVVNELLLDALHHAPAGAAIVLTCHREDDRFEFSVSNAALEPKISEGETGGETITVLRRANTDATFTVRLLETASRAVVDAASAPATRSNDGR